MIDILLLSDLHGKYGKMDQFLNLGADIILIAGDLTDFGPMEEAKAMLSRIDVPVLAIPGNCDPKDINEMLEYSDAVGLHGSSMEIGILTFTGIGGSNPTPFDTPFELSEEEIDDILTGAKPKRNVHNVLLSHAPPHGTLDRIGDGNVGSTGIRKHMQEYDLVCCGHIHEEKGVMEVDGVTIVNPGPSSEGNCALIHFGEETQDFTIELMTV